MKKYSIINITIILIIALTYSSVVYAKDTSLPFIDVSENAWYYEEVKMVSDKKIMIGKSNNRFDPNANMTRAEFVTVLCRLSGDDSCGEGTGLIFIDVEDSAWYIDYVGWGVDSEIVQGLPGNKFAPAQAVTRQEMAVFIDRFISYMNIGLKENAKVDSFLDTNKVASYAKDAVDTMRKSGIITGDQNGYFNPVNNASRAEVATVISRLLPIIDKNVNSGEVDSEPTYPYAVYLPDNYRSDKEYPLIIYVATRNLDGAEILFSASNSPANDSIVIVPELPTDSWGDSRTDKFAKLIDYVNSKYNIDKKRQYLIAVEGGGHMGWQLMLNYPQKISAAILVQASTVRFWNTADGRIIFEEDVNQDMANIPIYIVHDKTSIGELYQDYGKWVYEALLDKGFVDIHLKETTGYGDDIINQFVSKDDISLLDWLFAQHRKTK